MQKIIDLSHSMKKSYLYLCFFLLLVACNSTKSDKNAQNVPTTVFTQAKGLVITPHDGYTEVAIKNPWKEGSTLQTYILVPSNSSVPQNLPKGAVIRTPLTNALVYSSVHANAIKELGQLSSVKGVCDAQYFTMPEITEGVNNGTISNVGSSMSPITEKIIALSPDAIILSPYQNAGYDELARLGIPIIQCADYMEASPLGRAEWIKLFGLLYEEVDKADSIYNCVVKSYNELKQLAVTASANPKILSENIINGTWYVPGGDSYMAQLFNDAGGFYAWNDVHSTGSIPLDMPRVLEKAHDADIWLIKSFDSEFSYTKLKSQNPLNAEFKAFKEQKVYFCDTERTTLFQDFPFHPELLLKEYIAIFHPQLLPEYSLQYFKPLINE